MLLRKKNRMVRRREPKVPGGLDANRTNLYRAFLAVGQDAESQFAWLSDFADRDLSNPVAAELARWEADAFVQTWSVVWYVEPFVSLFGTKPGPNFLIAAGAAPGPIRPNRGPEFGHPDFGSEAVLEMQDEARRLFAELRRQREEPRAPGYAFKRDIFGELMITGVPPRARIVTRPDPVARFVGAIGSLFLASGSLAFCREPNCRRPFIEGRPWQQFCSPRCNNRFAQRKKRSKDRAAQKRGGRR